MMSIHHLVMDSNLKNIYLTENNFKKEWKPDKTIIKILKNLIHSYIM